MSKTNFVNPYNFIPLGKERAEASKEKRTLTGVVEYSLYTKTPLFIPNTTNDKAFKLGPVSGNETHPDHKAYDFFSYTDLSDKGRDQRDGCFLPVIPGSEMRGMLRSNYEILTNSCMSAIDDNITLSKRTGQTFKPALIKKNPDGTFDLYGAEDVLWRTKKEHCSTDELNWQDSYYTRKCYRQKDFPEGCKVYFERRKRERGKPLAEKVSFKGGNGRVTGYIIKGEDGPIMQRKEEKHCCHIFCLRGKTPLAENISFNILDMVLTEYKNQGVHEYAEYKSELKKFRSAETDQDEYFPVYYSNPAKRYLMLSPACITREIYRNKLKNMVGKFSPCTDRENLCPACSLFGTIGDNFQVSSRIRFSDLTCQCDGDAESCYDEVVTLLPLSTPKLGNMEFYLQRPGDAWFWTYDYYVTSKGEIKVYDKYPQINGRKFYWHQMDVKLKEDVARTNQNMTIRPVRSGVTFSGKLYFHKLTEGELNHLLWLLNGGDNGSLEKKEHGYKLGAAKPLGLGSVALAVTKVCIRKPVADREKHTVRMEEDFTFETSGNAEGLDEEVLKNYAKMTSFYAVEGQRVCYPTLNSENSADEGTNGYEWFVKNRQGYNRSKQKFENAPKERENMYFKEHMKAMEQELLQTTNLNNVGFRNAKGNKGKG